MAQDNPPQPLQVVREPLKVGEEAAYAAIENESALGGPKEVWWLNSFASETDRQRVTEDYLRNGPLMAVLDRNSKRKASVTGTPVNLVLNYRPDLSRRVRRKGAAGWAGLRGAPTVVCHVSSQDAG